MKRILITGAEGFIGSHLVEYFVRKGYDVRAFTWYNSWSQHGWLDTLPADVRDHIEFFPGDIRDHQRVSEAVKNQEAILHLAALITIPYSYLAPESYLDTNTKGTLNILQASQRHQCQHVLVTSTSEVYGTARYVPMDEQHPLQAQSPYSASKIAAEKLAESFFLSYQTPITIVRPFNNFGPRQSIRGLIPSLIVQLLKREDNILLGNPGPTRDWIYVTDTAIAYESILLHTNISGQAINIASGREISVGELAQTLINKIRPGAQITTDPQRLRPSSSEVWRLCGDYKLLHQYTGWQPQVSLENGLDLTIQWFENQLRQGNYQDSQFRI